MRFSSKTVFAYFLMFVLVFASSASAVVPEDYSTAAPEKLETGHLYGDSCILVDASTGNVLFEKDAYTRRYPASTTKIMTGILAIELGPIGQKITVPSGISVSTDSSKLGIFPGEIMLYDDLVYGMMMASGNDAAIAIAILCAQTEEQFVKLMNQKAAELGCIGTHFVNSHGLHNVNHYTTAYDLALITQYAMKNEMFRDIVACTEYVISPTNHHPDGMSVSTKYDVLLENKPLYYEYSVGVKTGYTKKAGRCFVGAAVKDDITLITVSLNTEPEDKEYKEAFTDTIRLSKYGFTLFAPMSFYDIYAMCDDQYLSVAINKAAYSDPNNGFLKLSIVEIPDAYQEWYLKSEIEDLNFQKNLVEDFTSRISVSFFEEALVAPIRKGDVLGTATYTTPAGEVLTGSVAASRDVEMEPPTVDEVMDEWIEANAPFLFKLMPRHNPPVRILYWALLAGVVFLIVVRVRKKRRLNRIRRQQLERKRREYLKREQQKQAYRKVNPTLQSAGRSVRTSQSRSSGAKRK